MWPRNWILNFTWCLTSLTVKYLSVLVCSLCSPVSIRNLAPHGGFPTNAIEPTPPTATKPSLLSSSVCLYKFYKVISTLLQACCCFSHLKKNLSWLQLPNWHCCIPLFLSRAKLPERIFYAHRRQFLFSYYFLNLHSETALNSDSMLINQVITLQSSTNQLQAAFYSCLTLSLTCFLLFTGLLDSHMPGFTPSSILIPIVIYFSSTSQPLMSEHPRLHAQTPCPFFLPFIHSLVYLI